MHALIVIDRASLHAMHPSGFPWVFFFPSVLFFLFVPQTSFPMYVCILYITNRLGKTVNEVLVLFFFWLFGCVRRLSMDDC